MIPVYLTIKGLYSYRQTQEIDFSRLTETALFGIFGKVGSGKSSILEAITFALYGETDRLNKSGDDRNYNMMNLRSDELMIDYICLAGQEGHKYRFTVKGRRNSKRFDDVKTFERRAYRWMDELDDWAPIETDQVAEKIIGLSYENFKRTIIIPQGKFQDFLDLPQAQRTRMMNEIFQLERYDLAAKVKILKIRNDTLLENLAGKLTQLGQTTPELLEQSRQGLKNTQALIKLTDNELKVLTADEKQLETLRQLFVDKQNAEQKITALATQEADFMARAARLDRYLSCRNTFKLVLEQKKIQETALARDQGTLREKEKSMAEVQQRIADERKKLAEILPQYEQRDALKKETEELGLVLTLAQSKEERAKLEDDQKRGRIAFVQKKDIIGQLTQQKGELETTLDKAKSGRVDLEVVTKVAEWFSTKNAILATKESVKKDAKAVADDEEKLEKSKADLLLAAPFDALFGPEDAATPPVRLRERIDEEKQRLVGQHAELEKDILHLKTQRELRKYAHDLQPGEPCPLCGSLHHPQVMGGASVLENELMAFEQKQKKLRETEIAYDQLKNQLSVLEKEFALYERQKKVIREKWEENKAALARQDAAFTWPDFSKDDEEKVQEAFQKDRQQQGEIKQLEATYRQKERELNEARDLLDNKIRPALETIEQKLAAKMAETEGYQKQIIRLDVAEFANQTAEQIRYRIHAQNTAYNKLTEAYEQLTQKIQALTDQQNILSGEITSLKTNTGQQAEALRELNENLAKDIAASDFADESEVLAMLQSELNVATEQQEIETYRLTLNTARAALKTLEEKTAGLRYDTGIHEKVRADLETQTIRINELRKEEGGLTNQVKKQEEDLAAQVDLRKEQEKLDIRGKDIETLSKLFKASGFVSYVSAMHLQNLCNQANARFHKMTRHQLQLELYEPRPAEYDFQVRDLLNEGRTRAVKTLSGGQKFQVALALALALADQIHAQSHAMHNFFFLDEGFGSLDKDSLGEVFETLQSLRRENRIVGVISHVEDLQQEIQNHLKIELTEAGSLVIPNY
ncbi:SbcC/MukB-like Walker B domain-containing protein [Salmonirosea aquatica]|uniref:SMC family ATPase n=1 Tax=Salmonirosea aquatica TaxID=2654236 RepID=A0A7C9FZA9_9BACT|nr:SMC family ATPase [Cytophagaceae bacterium SJW1-29]